MMPTVLERWWIQNISWAASTASDGGGYAVVAYTSGPPGLCTELRVFTVLSALSAALFVRRSYGEVWLERTACCYSHG